MNREAKWVLGVVTGLVLMGGVAKLCWWLGAQNAEIPKIEAVVIPPAPPAPPVTTEPTHQTIVAETPATAGFQQQQTNRQTTNRNFQPQQLTPDQQAQFDQQRAAATQRVADALANTQADPNSNTITIQGANGPRQMQLPQNMQVTANPDGSISGVTLPNGRTINLQGLLNGNGGGGNANNGGARNRNRGGNAGNFPNGNNGNGGFNNNGNFGNGAVDPNAAVDPNQGQ